MSQRPIHQCQCEICQSPQPHADKEDHHRMNVLLSRLNEQHRRWYVALEAERIGHGGSERLAQITGMNVNTIRRGRRELNDGLGRTAQPSRVRKPGGGRASAGKKSPAIGETESRKSSTTTSLVQPTDEQKWVKLSLRTIASRAARTGIQDRSHHSRSAAAQAGIWLGRQPQALDGRSASRPQPPV